MNNVKFLEHLLRGYGGPLPIQIAGQQGKAARHMDVFGGYDVWVFATPPTPRQVLERLDLRDEEHRARFNASFKLTRS